ncbi:MAG: SDR family NAD(P)-dependent oxidoreductase [Pseudomonadota bacterium]
MSSTFILDRSIEVKRPLDEVFAYVSAFERIEEWDPGVARARKLTPGATAPGTKVLIEMRSGLELNYEFVEVKPESLLKMSVQSRLFTAQEEISFKRLARGVTEVRYIAEFDFRQPLNLFTRLYPRGMQQLADATMDGLKAALEDANPLPSGSRIAELGDKLLLPGAWQFTRRGYRSARRDWLPISADLRGRHVVLTGPTSGIGRAAAEWLAARGATLTLVARDERRARELIERIATETGNDNLHLEVCDLSLMADVISLVDRLKDAGDAIDVLINNAGALFNEREDTSEGLEKSFALLLLSPFILTEGLKPLLAARKGGRVINVSSGGMYTQKIQVDDLQSEQGTYAGPVAYARAKRGLMILTEVWARRWEKDGIVVNAMHPGWADTPGVAESLPGFRKLMGPLLRTPEEGADTVCWLAAATEAGKISGEFFLDRKPHLSHVFSHTQETELERAQLLRELRHFRNDTFYRDGGGTEVAGSKS